MKQRIAGAWVGPATQPWAPLATLEADYAPKREHDAASVVTQQTTTSTTYADLATVGPAVTVTVPASGAVRVSLSAEIENAGTAPIRRSYAGFAISGANTAAAADATACLVRNSQGDPVVSGRSVVVEGLTPGVTTFTMKYRVEASTGTFVNRHINVETLP